MRCFARRVDARATGAHPAPATRRIGIDTVNDLLITSRWIHFVAISFLFGSSLWWLVEPSANMARRLDGGIVATRTKLPVRVASVAAAASGIGWLVCSLATMTGDMRSVLDPDTMELLFFETPFGTVLLVRIALLSILLSTAFAPISNHSRLVSITIVAGLLLVSQAWLGHAAQGGPGLFGAMMIIVYAIHVLAAGAWAGALPALLASVIARSDNGAIFDLLRRYSAVATLAVAAIVGSGIANTLSHADRSMTALASSTYGMVLFAKIGLVAGMLVCAAWNRFIAMPRLRDRVADAPGLSALRISLSFELALGLLVLGMASVLGVTPPPA